MFEFRAAPVSVRPDLRYAYVSLWDHIGRPGPTLTGPQRTSLLEAVRNASAGDSAGDIDIHPALGHLADSLYHDPIAVDGTMVRTAADAASALRQL